MVGLSEVMGSWKIMPISRFGLNKLKTGPLVRASFEETAEVLTEAAFFGQKNKISAVSDSIMVGQNIPGGTGIVKLLLNPEYLKDVRIQRQRVVTDSLQRSSSGHDKSNPVVIRQSTGGEIITSATKVIRTFYTDQKFLSRRIRHRLPAKWPLVNHKQPLQPHEMFQGNSGTKTTLRDNGVSDVYHPGRLSQSIAELWSTTPPNSGSKKSDFVRLDDLDEIVSALSRPVWALPTGAVIKSVPQPMSFEYGSYTADSPPSRTGLDASGYAPSSPSYDPEWKHNTAAADSPVYTGYLSPDHNDSNYNPMSPSFDWRDTDAVEEEQKADNSGYSSHAVDSNNSDRIYIPATATSPGYWDKREEDKENTVGYELPEEMKDYEFDQYGTNDNTVVAATEEQDKTNDLLLSVMQLLSEHQK